jgi:hypothetical protein
MFYSSSRRLLSILCLLLLFWLQPFASEVISALAVPLSVNSSQVTVEASYDWNEVQQAIAEGVRKVCPSIDEFAANELDFWMAERMKQVDEKFLNWYFGFIHQKATQDGVPFAWVAFKVDFLDWLKEEDEKGLTPKQIIQKRMLKELEQKFDELVLNEDALNDLRDRIEHIARNYASALSFQFELIKAKYYVPDQDWEQHTLQIAQTIYNTGTSKSSFTSDSLSSLLVTKCITAVSVALVSNSSFKFTIKVAPKLAIKGGSLAILETSVNFIHPLFFAGLLIWDFADYQAMVNKSRAELRKNIEDYLSLVKSNIYNSPNGSIITAIDEVENQIIRLLA